MTDGWIATSLGDICNGTGAIQTGPFGSQLHAEDYSEHGVPVIMPVNIGDNRISEAGIARVSADHVERLSRHKVRVGDIVYSRRGDITRRALIREREAGWLCGTGCLLVRPSAGVDSVWLSYWLGTPFVHEWLMQRAVGATMPNLNTGILSELPVSLPPLDEQRRIAGVLGALDDLIEVDRRLILDLSNLSDAAFEEWASGVADLVPLDRTMRRVADGVDSDALGSHGIYLGLEHFGTDAVGLTSRGTTDGLASNKVQFKAGDVLYGKLRPYFRKVARPGFSGVCTTEAWVLRGRVPATQEYVHWIARRANFTLTAMAGSEGTKMPRANWAHLARMLVPDPQAPGLDSVSQSVRTLWETACALSQEIEELSAARDELVPLLVSGRVRVGEVAA